MVRDHEGNLWIETRRQKTGTPENVRPLDIAIEIMKKYRGVAPDGKLFPMLTKESMNIHLKKMAAQCGIDRNLSFHMARHSFRFPDLSLTGRTHRDCQQSVWAQEYQHHAALC